MHACIDVGNEQITACRRFVCNVAEQACGIASLLFHKLMRVMIEAHRREVVRCQPDHFPPEHDHCSKAHTITGNTHCFFIVDSLPS